MANKKIEKFTYYGGGGTSDREISLWKDSDGFYEVRIEGYDRETKSRLDYDIAMDVLRSIQGMAKKDWGHSEIEWLELPESPEAREE